MKRTLSWLPLFTTFVLCIAGPPTFGQETEERQFSRERVPELLRLRDVPPVLREQPGDGVDDAGAVGAGQREHPVGRRDRGGGHEVRE